MLQTGELHRLVAMSTFPLIALHFAMMLVFELPDYANDIKFEKLTLMVRVGWEHGVTFHNILILVAYLLIGLAMLFGFPSVGRTTCFALTPAGVVPNLVCQSNCYGAKPNWNLLGMLAVWYLV